MDQKCSKSHHEEQDMTRTQDGQQIGVGYYALRQATIQVGRLLVVEIRPGMSTEHWDLWAGFRQPSWSNTRQDISFEYKGEPISVKDFQQGIRAGCTYIIAQCEHQTNQ
ncbi:hypothetical protein WME91_38825 [Sorangium sp. So ce269]